MAAQLRRVFLLQAITVALVLILLLANGADARPIRMDRGTLDTRDDCDCGGKVDEGWKIAAIVLAVVAGIPPFLGLLYLFGGFCAIGWLVACGQ
jgi:hypothetical protein